jgi:hypothetical protein
MVRLWLIFAQAATVAVAVLFVISTFRPEWLPSPGTGGPAFGGATGARDRPAPRGSEHRLL